MSAICVRISSRRIGVSEVGSDFVKPPYSGILEKRQRVLLDGGLATELERHGFSLEDKLWSASILSTSPEAIYQVHADYLAAGADCIISATYQASFEGFAAAGVARTEAARLMLEAVALARRARDSHCVNQGISSGSSLVPLVAASIGPYGAYLANGAEYTGEYNVDADKLRDFHAPRLELLAESGAELLAVETIPSFTETRVLTELLGEMDSACAWVSFSCRDEAHVSDGTPIEHCVELCRDVPAICAVGINCLRPVYATALIKRIRETAPEKDIVVYPNLGESYDANTNNWRGVGDNAAFASYALEWYAAGAKLIGGCCRTTPEDIRAIDLLLPSRPD